MTKNKVVVLGTGAWGTALANVLADSGNDVFMWGVNQSEVDDINKHHNKKYYGNKRINSRISASTNLKEALFRANYIVLAIPSIFLKDVLKSSKEFILNKPIIINATKGLDPDTMSPWGDTIKEILSSNDVASLTGPSFAIDVIDKKPTIVNIVTKSESLFKKISYIFNCDYFKIVNCKDENGSEICGAIKNLLAIGIGIAHENHNSINTVSALLTTGINEIKEIISLQNGEQKTILDYCGIGDIFLTCTSDKSRNFSFGKQLYKHGLNKSLIMNSNTVEGYTVSKVVEKIIEKKSDKFPILNSICMVLSNKLKPRDFVNYSIELIGLKDENK